MTIAFPKFISSDEDLNVTYDYRCSIYQQHIKKTPIGHVITEFLPENFVVISACKTLQTHSAY